MLGSLRPWSPTAVRSDCSRARSGHLLGLRERGPQRPLAEHVLARAQRRHHELVMQRHAHRHDDEVDVRVRHDRVDVVEGEGRAEARGGGLRRVLVRGADRHELVVGQGVEGGHVGVRAPAAPPGRHGRAHDANADGVCHRSLHSLRATVRALSFARCPLRFPRGASKSTGPIAYGWCSCRSASGAGCRRPIQDQEALELVTSQAGLPHDCAQEPDLTCCPAGRSR